MKTLLDGGFIGIDLVLAIAVLCQKTTDAVIKTANMGYVIVTCS